MADPPSSSPATQQPAPDTQTTQPDPSSSTTSTAPPPPPQLQQTSLSNPPAFNPNPNPNPNPSLPPLMPPYGPPPIAGASIPPVGPSYRPLPQFSPLPIYQNTSVGVPPPGVSAAPPQPMMAYQIPNPAFRPYAPPLPNGYPAAPPPGIPRYPAPYTPVVRPLFAQRPPGMLPVAPRPLVPMAPSVRPIVPPVVRPAIPSVTPTEKPQTTVYVGKIAPTVENDFILSVLQICGPVKNWKRAQDPTNGTPKGYGFCEFEFSEGVLRALRLLTKFNIDGQELLVNVSEATKEYLERYVEKKTENSKNMKETQATGADKEAADGKGDTTSHGSEKNEASQSYLEDSAKDGDGGNKENHEHANFGLVTDADKDGDQEALNKLSSIIEERLKTRSLPPPPPPLQAVADGPGSSSSDLLAKSKDGDSDVDVMRHDAVDDRNGDETPNDNKTASEPDRPGTGSPDRTKRYDRRSRDRERDRDREKERELDRYEREAERERVRKEREHRRRIEEAEREYEERLKDWEYREREKEKQRQYEKERDKERERKRRKEILLDEEEEDDDSRKRWRRSVLEDKRRKRLREKEDDLADTLKEKGEIIESMRRAEEEKMRQQEIDAMEVSSGPAINESEQRVLVEETIVQSKDKNVEDNEHDSYNDDHTGNGVLQNGTVDESATTAIMVESDMRQSGNVPTRKLGFGLVGSGKRAAVPSVFHEEDDEEAQKEKKMRPLVPIDYSAEELQAVQPTISGAQAPNLVAAAEFAKRISNVTPREEKADLDREKSRRSHDRSSQRERERSDDDDNRTRDENKEKIHERDKHREHGLDKVKTSDKQKLLDAKQLIDMIPKTKEELFSYEINWAVYDKHSLHERMRPWISKKIMEFLGEEVSSLVDYIVLQTQEHVKASDVLEQLQTILDDEAEMFVLKMWRMLIFEIKKVETGLALRSKT